MVRSRKFTVDLPSESVRESVSVATAPTWISPFEAHALVWISLPFDLEEKLGFTVLWTPVIRTTSPLEVALILVLFVMISALVGVRLFELLSEYDVDRSTLPIRTGSTDTDDTQPDRNRSYEGIVSAETPLKFLSDEGQVVRLLVENDGQIRQHQIVEETGWSKSKVSRILSKMHDAGNIEKVSLGRENVISLTERERAEDDQPDEAEYPLP